VYANNKVIHFCQLSGCLSAHPTNFFISAVLYAPNLALDGAATTPSVGDLDKMSLFQSGRF
jgi:hypothetical protein